MIEYAIILFLLFLILLLLGVPIAASLGVASAVFILIKSLGISIFAANVCGGIAKFPLLAIPFYILAALIFKEVGLAEKIIILIKLLVGSFPGGLAVVVVIACIFWGAICGSSPATVAALGTIFIPIMEKDGYPVNFSTALVCSAAGLAMLIPPSIPFIVYGSITNDSVTALFSAGIIPGIVTGFFIAITAWFISWRKGYRSEPRGSFKDIGKSFVHAIWALFAPLIILGGIYGGVFSPTEAAVVGVFYALFLGFFIYRNLSIKTLYNLLVDTSVSSAVVMFLVGFGTIFSWVGHVLGVMEASTNFFMSISENPYIILLMIQVLIIIAGMFIDPISIYYVFIPIFIPIMIHFKWSSIWFGVLLTTNICIAQITPPVALNLYVGANISGLSIETISKSVIVFIIAMVVALFVLSLFPELSLYLPTIWKHI